MLDVKQAVKKAKELFLEISEEDITGLRLEEVDFSEAAGGSQGEWKITFSYTTIDIPITRYKTIILRGDGEFASMKIRVLN